MTKVFVYGTLKRGQDNHKNYLARSAFVGEADTASRYRMISTNFPVILEDGDGKPVRGEIYDVDDRTLAALDRLEGNGHMYLRRLIDASLIRGGPVQCWIYEGMPERWGRVIWPDWTETVDGALCWKGSSNELEIEEDEDPPEEDLCDCDDDEVVESEDQDQGDVLGLHDEREEP
jgi:gamma-glutamylaminecyclotransferase